MSNVSVKLDESTHQRLKELASREGITPHALMVQAIASELDDIELRQGFIERARLAQERAEAGGPVYEGPAYAAYLRERVRSALVRDKATVRRPKPTTLLALKTTRKAKA
ncbi:MAG TPA: hypothetical protein PKC60_10290 [Hydrogenophaga sp.]|uniref:CopG family ribbon-helix-helix protein n=1 Tax=Hydrogenophaga sp. TaxID=1904254 RepID=UPI002C52AA2A|nr:hypothetical protein [Hydrogenophaga sp.]HMN93607.1 hypothetical protein [Hydrogenophaga sp.]HMP09553.1 hypothetical protein [Hydrogenophaga sp.]